MKTINFKCILFVALSCGLFFSSCDKDESYSSGSVSSQTPLGDLVSTGSCTAFGLTSATAKMYYVKENDVYYLDYFYNGGGSFGFKWDKETNKISLIYSETGIYNDFYPIDFLDQKDYDAVMGDKAIPSYYDPVRDIFVFNVLYQTAISDGNIVRYETEITYVPKTAGE